MVSSFFALILVNDLFVEIDIPLKVFCFSFKNNALFLGIDVSLSFFLKIKIYLNNKIISINKVLSNYPLDRSVRC